MTDKTDTHYQTLFNFPQYGPWIVTHKGDQGCRQLADRHYSRVTVGAHYFTQPGFNMVLTTKDQDAVWVTWSGIRDDGYNAYECSIFRNESEHLSSELIEHAINATIDILGNPPPDGMITFVQPNKIASRNPGYCFKLAGFKSAGKSKERKLVRLQLDWKDEATRKRYPLKDS